MRITSSFIIPVFLLSIVLLNGCVARFDPRVTSPNEIKYGLPTVKVEQEGLEVSVEEFVSANKSRRVFDADIASHGVLPLLIRVENHGIEEYRMDRSQVVAILDGQRLGPLYGYEAAKQGATREYVGKALANTAMLGPLALYFWPVTMGVSAQHTRDINQKVEQHFESLELTGASLKPGESMTGFVFFDLPGRRKTIEGLTVEVIAQAPAYEGRPGRRIAYRLPLPALGVSSPRVQTHTDEDDPIDQVALESR